MAGNTTLIRSPRNYLPVNLYLDKATQDSTQDAEIIGTKNFTGTKIIRDCSVTAISCQLSDAITNGTIDIQLVKNGTGTTVSTIDSGSGTLLTIELSPGAATFSTGDEIGIKTVSSAGLAPNSSIEILFNIEIQYSG